MPTIGSKEHDLRRAAPMPGMARIFADANAKAPSADRRRRRVFAIVRLSIGLLPVVVAACGFGIYHGHFKDHFIDQAFYELGENSKTRLQAEIDSLYPAGTPVMRMVRDLESFGATCESRGTAGKEHHSCKYEQYEIDFLLVFLIPVPHGRKVFIARFDIIGDDGLIQKAVVTSVGSQFRPL
jgi:hypothetical protein